MEEASVGPSYSFGAREGETPQLVVKERVWVGQGPQGMGVGGRTFSLERLMGGLWGQSRTGGPGTHCSMSPFGSGLVRHGTEKAVGIQDRGCY